MVLLTTGSLTVTAGTLSSSGSLTYTSRLFKVRIYPTQELSLELRRSVYGTANQSIPALPLQEL
jgi:hypothetical protein